MHDLFTSQRIHTSMVFPFDAVTISPGLMPVPLIMFSQAATMKWTCDTRHLYSDRRNILKDSTTQSRSTKWSIRAISLHHIRTKKIKLMTSTPEGLIWPIAFAAPRTAAEPPISNFMSSMEQPGPGLML